MKHSLLMTVTALSIAAGTQAFAQTAVIQVTPEQRTSIREYVVKQKTPSVTIPGDVRVGAPLPADVQLVVVPNEWGPSYSKFRFVHWNNKVVLVDPSNRQVVHIVE